MSVARFRMNTDIRIGLDVLKDLPNIILKEGYANLSIIIDHNVTSNQKIKNLISNIKSNFSAEVYTCQVSEPDYHFLEEFRNQISNKNMIA